MTKSTEDPDMAAVLERAERDLEFVNETGQKEDIAMVTGIQRSLHSKANEHFTFGHFEQSSQIKQAGAAYKWRGSASLQSQ